MKPTELQKKVCEHIITEAKYWRDTNDISSPTHYADLQDCLFVEFDDVLSEQQLDELEYKLHDILAFIKNLKA